MQLEIRGLEKLSFRERQVVALKETGVNNETVAKRLGLSPATVATLFNRAKTKGYRVVLIIDGDPLGVLGGEDDSEEAEE
jgi:FixJ family two-component response regulator